MPFFFLLQLRHTMFMNNCVECMIRFFLLLTWVIVYESWGYPSIGAPTTLTHGKVRWVGGVLILDVGLLRGHGRRHCYPGILGLLSQTS